VLDPGTQTLLLLAADNQEAKNVNTIGLNALPNTTIRTAKLRVVDGPALTWISPGTGACTAKQEPLVVLASDTAKISAVTFFDGKHEIASDRAGVLDLFSANWKTRGLAHGRHLLHAVVTDRQGRKATAARSARIC
jgi:hypothetical protein